MAGKVVPRETRLLATQVRLRDPKAIRKVVKALQNNGGNMTTAAAELGVYVRTLYLWIDDVPELAEHRRGRIGRPPAEETAAAAKKSAKRAGPRRPAA